MGMNEIWRKTSWLFTIVALFGLMLPGAGCDDGSSGSDGAAAEAADDESQSNAEEDSDAPGPIVAFGDSITSGEADPGVPSYPSRLAQIKGEDVYNRGVGGISSCAAANAINLALSLDPRIVLILLGTNNVLAGHDPAEAKECLRWIIQDVKDAGGRPIIGTIPPLVGDKASLMPIVDQMNALIRALAAEEQATLVDLANEFGTGEGLMLADGIHPNGTGAQLIALAFSESF